MLTKPPPDADCAWCKFFAPYPNGKPWCFLYDQEAPDQPCSDFEEDTD